MTVANAGAKDSDNGASPTSPSKATVATHAISIAARWQQEKRFLPRQDRGEGRYTDSSCCPTARANDHCRGNREGRCSGFSPMYNSMEFDLIAQANLNSFIAIK